MECEQYEQKIESQKQLLSKAKNLIDKLRGELGEKDAALAEERQKRDSLEAVIRKLLTEEDSDHRNGEVTQVIEQYESRMKRMQDHYEQTQKQLHEALELLRTTKERNSEHQQLVNQQVKTLIGESEDIREACLQYLADCDDEGYRAECQGKVKVLLLQMQKMTFDVSALNYLKNHLLVLHQSIFDVNRRLTQAAQQIAEMEAQEKSLHDTLTGELQRERKDKLKHIEAGRAHIRQLETAIETQHAEHLKVLTQRDQKIELMQKEMHRNANLEYIKNVVIGYFCNDTSVQRKTIPVIATALQLTEAEHVLIREGFEAQQRWKIFR